jgi:hypothetical protein
MSNHSFDRYESVELGEAPQRKSSKKSSKKSQSHGAVATTAASHGNGGGHGHDVRQQGCIPSVPIVLLMKELFFIVGN